MKVSYFKTQWFNLVMALGAIVAVIVNMVQGDELMTIAWTVSFMYWMVFSFIDYNTERIKLLEAKAEKYDALVKKVDALQELLETEHKYSNHLNQRIDSLVYEVKELKED